MKEGDVVAVIGKITSKIKDRDSSKLEFGTLMQFMNDKEVMVLLSDGTIFVGKLHDIAPYEEQKEN